MVDVEVPTNKARGLGDRGGLDVSRDVFKLPLVCQQWGRWFYYRSCQWVYLTKGLLVPLPKVDSSTKFSQRNLGLPLSFKN